MEIKMSVAKSAAMSVDAKRRTYFLSAGHRGERTGAMGYFDEGRETISLRDAVAKYMRERGCSVVTDENKADLNSVAASINRQCSPNDISVDIHFNASSNPSANGTEVLIKNASTAEEKVLAKSLLDAMVGVMGTKSRGVKNESSGQHTTLKMLSGIRCNAVLLEVCFCTNSTDASVYQQHFFDVASVIGMALMRAK